MRNSLTTEIHRFFKLHDCLVKFSYVDPTGKLVALRFICNENVNPGFITSGLIDYLNSNHFQNRLGRSMFEICFSAFNPVKNQTSIIIKEKKDD